jgi:hypothetical protein
LKKYLKKKIVSPLLKYLKKGVSVPKMSLTLSLGICLGIMPLIGIPGWLLLLLALIFKLNIPILQLINYIISILKYLLFIPFLKIGHKVFFPNEQTPDIQNILANYQSDFLGTFKSFWHMNLGGIFLWAMVAIPLGILIYYKSQPFLLRQKLRTAIIRA